MKIYTKTGDKGKTSLFGGKRVWKNNVRINAYGTVDELNSALGVSVCEIKNKEIEDVIISIQHELFVLGSELASPVEKGKAGKIIFKIDESKTKLLEALIDKFDNQLPVLKNFIIPGGSKGAALIHNARSICRRAEREIITLSKEELINPEIIIYLNRLSDLLFVLARFENFSSNHPEIEWKK